MPNLHDGLFLLPNDVGGKKSDDLVIIFDGQSDQGLQIVFKNGLECSKDSIRTRNFEFWLDTNLSLVHFGGRVIFPQLAFGQVGDLLDDSFPNSIPYSLVEIQYIRIHFLYFPGFLAVSRVNEHDKRQDLLPTVIRPHERMRYSDCCIREVGR